ncbi:DUF551 domain-containing protein [Escherichia coli]
MADALGVFGDAAVQKVLDNLSQQKLVHRDVLPFSLPVTPDGWISCSDAVPAEYCDVILLDDLGNVFPGSWDKVFCPTCGGNKMAFVDKDGVEVESSTHWMPLPEPPQEVNG